MKLYLIAGGVVLVIVATALFLTGSVREWVAMAGGIAIWERFRRTQRILVAVALSLFLIGAGLIVAAIR